MPGRTPTEAFEAFVEPLERAVSCLGSAKLTSSRGGRGTVGADHSLSINRADGLRLSNGLLFDSRLVYRIIRDERSRSQPFRITTMTYLQVLRDSKGVEVIFAHWHPAGSSPYKRPHWHLGTAALSDSGVLTPRAHLPSPRVSIEAMVRLAISLGAAPARGEWEEVLDRCESDFVQH